MSTEESKKGITAEQFYVETSENFKMIAESMPIIFKILHRLDERITRLETLTNPPTGSK